MKIKKAQAAIEFIILVSVILFFFTIFFMLIQENMSDKIQERQNLELKEIGITFQNEINLASKAGDGYYREFKIPDKIGNKDYTISITENMVYLKTSDNKNAVAFPVLDINGQPLKGTNKIEKQQGEIYLN